MDLTLLGALFGIAAEFDDDVRWKGNARSWSELFGRAGTKPALDRAYELFPVLGRRRQQTAGSLSGGEQRMLTLGRVLVAESFV